MPDPRDQDRRLLQLQARDADEHRRMRSAYRMGWHAATLAAINAIAELKAPELPAYEESSDE